MLGQEGFRNKSETTGPVLSGLTCGRAGGSESRTGALDISGAAGLSLVEGPFQLPSPLITVVLLTNVLEDLLCGGQSKTIES